MYLSREMTTKCRMEAVHIQTSTASHMEHQTLPKSHILKTSYMAENGNTTMPSMRSAQAKETMNKLVAPRSLCVILTAVITMMLPKMTMRQTSPRGNRDPKILGSSKSTLSKGELQFSIQIT